MRIVAACLALCLLLSGCTGWMDGSYVSIKPHVMDPEIQEQGSVTVSNEAQMFAALEALVERGSESGKIYLQDLSSESAEAAMGNAVSSLLSNHPVSVFVAEEITWELGTAGNRSAMAVTIRYNQNRVQLHNIQKAAGMTQVGELISAALRDCSPYLVMEVSSYSSTDFTQLVRDYADAYPEQVMEVPRVSVDMYPEKGTERVIELRFDYQTDTQALREMQDYVQPVFTSAIMYVLGEDQQLRKFDQLHSFLMGRNDYTLSTSITPAYTLLRHGVGDSRAFAVVYAAMCVDAGLECRVISGTHEGASHFWNLICVDGAYYHVDLLNGSGVFQMLRDNEMAGYVWDYSAYPAAL